MSNTPTVLERAFELARSGKCLNLMDTALTLKSEGYSITQIEGPVLKRQLLALIEQAKQFDRH